MDFLKVKVARSKLGEVFYVLFNALLPFALLILVRAFDPPYIALALVLLSKWRVFALRPRYWLTGIKTNLVDIAVGLCTVGLMHIASSVVVLQVMLAIGYMLWLLFIKPRSGKKAVALQAGIGQAAALLTLFSFSLMIPEFFVVLFAWIIGYMSARHLVSHYEETNVELLAALWGLFIAQLAWLSYQWTTVYNLGMPILVPQIVILSFVIGYSAAKIYSLHKQEALNKRTLRNIVLFCVGLVAFILLFSPWDPTI